VGRKAALDGDDLRGKGRTGFDQDTTRRMDAETLSLSTYPIHHKNTLRVQTKGEKGRRRSAKLE